MYWFVLKKEERDREKIVHACYCACSSPGEECLLQLYTSAGQERRPAGGERQAEERARPRDRAPARAARRSRRGRNLQLPFECELNFLHDM